MAKKKKKNMSASSQAASTLAGHKWSTANPQQKRKYLNQLSRARARAKAVRAANKKTAASERRIAQQKASVAASRRAPAVTPAQRVQGQAVASLPSYRRTPGQGPARPRPARPRPPPRSGGAPTRRPGVVDLFARPNPVAERAQRRAEDDRTAGLM